MVRAFLMLVLFSSQAANAAVYTDLMLPSTLIPTTRYFFEYHAPAQSISVNDRNSEDQNGDRERLAKLHPDEGLYFVQAALGFGIRGHAPLHLDGQRLTAVGRYGADVPQVLVDRMMYGYFFYSEAYLEYADSGSYVDFGPGMAIAHWLFSVSDTDGGAYAFTASSAGRVLEQAEHGAVNGDLINGLTVFDSYYWEPFDLAYSTRPGYWSVKIEKLCESDGESDPDLTKCVTTTPIPLPATLPLAGLALVALWRVRQGRTR